MAAGFVFAETSDTDRRAGRNLSQELNGLTPCRVREQFAFVAIEELLALRFFLGTEGANLRHQLGVRREGWKPQVEIAIDNPPAFGYAARRMARDTNAKSLFRLDRRANLKCRQLQLRFHGAYPLVRNHSMAARMAGYTGTMRKPSSCCARAEDANIFLRPMRTSSSVARGSLPRRRPVMSSSKKA